MKQIKRGLILGGLVCVFLIGCFVGNPVQTNAVTNNPLLGSIESYNAIVRGDYEATQADSEGSVAIGNNLFAPSKAGESYTLGAAYSGAGNQHIGGIFDDSLGPVLLLGGTYQNGGTGLFAKGDVTTHATSNVTTSTVSILNNLNTLAQTQIKNHIEAMIQEGTTYLEEATHFTLGRTIDGGNGYNSTQTTFYVAAEDESVNLGVIDTNSSTITIGEMYAPSNTLDQEATIIYSPATTVNFTTGGTIYNGQVINTNQLFNPDSNFTKAASRVLYYFPNATNIQLNSAGVIGSVFAPNAHLNGNGGAINGQAMLDSVFSDAGFEFHNFTFNWRRKLQTGRVELTKYVEGTNNPLAGASFKVSDTAGNVLGVFVTDANGHIVIENIPYGEYIVSEVTSPDGYLNSYEPIHVVIDAQNSQYIVSAFNKEVIGQVALKKVDQETGDVLAGALYAIYDANNIEIDRQTSNAQGMIVFNNLAYGTYTIKELSPPTGYDATNTSFEVQVKDDQLLTYTLTNEKTKTGRFQLTKVDSGILGSLLQGAVYEIQNDKQEVVAQITSDVNGVAQLADLAYGTYTVQEIQAPPGYVADPNTHTFTIDANHLDIAWMYHNQGELPGIETGSIKLYKTDAVDATIPLEGAVFLLTSVETEQTYNLITNAQGIATQDNLPFGEYRLQEIEAPDGYILQNFETTFTLDGNVFEMYYEFTNQKIQNNGEVEIIKRDASGTNELMQGVGFTLTNLTTNETQTMETNAQGYASFEGLPFGLYSLSETITPQGYISDGMVYTFELDEMVTKLHFDLYNVPILKKLKLIKVEDTNELNYLKDAIFRLEDEQGTFLGRATSNERGEVFFEDIPYTLQQVVLIEEKAPVGFDAMLEPMFIDISNQDAVVYYKKIENKKIKIPEKPVEPEKPSNPNIVVEGPDTYDLRNANAWILLVLMMLLVLFAFNVPSLCKQGEKG